LDTKKIIKTGFGNWKHCVQVCMERGS